MAFRVVSNEEFNQIKNSSAVSNAQPVGVNGTVSPTNANPQLSTRGVGQFTSVDDYLDKTGQRAINDANRLATYDSQMFKNALNNVSAQDAQNFTYNPMTGGYNSNESMAERDRLVNKMMQSGTNYARINPTEQAPVAPMDAANSAYNDTQSAIAEIENRVRSEVLSTGVKDKSTKYNTDYNRALAAEKAKNKEYADLLALRDEVGGEIGSMNKEATRQERAANNDYRGDYGINIQSSIRDIRKNDMAGYYDLITAWEEYQKKNGLNVGFDPDITPLESTEFQNFFTDWESRRT